MKALLCESIVGLLFYKHFKMEEFVIENGPDFLRISIKEVLGFPDSTSPFGGYDVKCNIDISSNGFGVTSDFWTSTGVFYELFDKLSACNKSLNGEIYFENFEHQLEFVIKYDTLGHASVQGSFSDSTNKLTFEFVTDQTFIQNTLRQLSAIVQKYGGMKGIKYSL